MSLLSSDILLEENADGPELMWQLIYCVMLKAWGQVLPLLVVGAGMRDGKKAAISHFVGLAHRVAKTELQRNQHTWNQYPEQWWPQP